MAVLNNLYPPIVNTYTPSQIRGESYKIYFSLSPYNLKDEIKYAQIAINNQITNFSMLDEDKYPSEIKVSAIYQDGKDYFVTIDAEDLAEGNFDINQYYKIQIRLVGSDAESIYLSTPQTIASWLDDNIDYFSEWSTVTLFRAISAPKIKFDNFKQSENKFILEDLSLHFSGNLAFEDINETENLKEYKIELLSKNSEDITINTLPIKAKRDNPRYLKYSFNTLLQENTEYILNIEYTTQNGYKGKEELEFTTYTQEKEKDYHGKIMAEAENDIGHIKVSFISDTYLPNKLIFKRTSSKSNFTEWELIHTIENLPTLNNTYSWNDYCLENGVWYKYAVQGESEGNKTKIFFSTPTILMADDVILVGNEVQLKVTYNFQINSYSRIKSEAIIETIGSQFPFVRSNSTVNYKKFSISGLLASEADEERLFASEEELLGGKQGYSLAKEQNLIFQDYLREREFREKAIDFLMDGQPKLFKSLTEGNILVKLTNVSLTPITTLGRKLYTFSADVYEIASCNIENYKKFNLLNINYSAEVEYYFEVISYETEKERINVEKEEIYNPKTMILHEKLVKINKIGDE